MKKIFGMLCLFVFLQKPLATAQTDTPETLQWVENQGNRIDSLLLNAMRSHDQVDIIFKLMDAFLIFDAVALAGVYCPEIRAATQAGRNQTDVLNYRLEKDMNSSMIRATRAREEAEKMKNAARNCRNALAPGAEKKFSPTDVIRQDAQIVELDLSDGMAAGDFHILSQKLEHAIRVLHDIQHLAATFQKCNRAEELAAKAIEHCESALGARNWTEVAAEVEAALGVAKTLTTLDCK